MSLSSTPSVTQLKRAIEVAEKIQALEAELAAILGGAVVASKRGRKPNAVKAIEEVVKKEKEKTKTKRKRVLSPEARERIAAAQRKRWGKE